MINNIATLPDYRDQSPKVADRFKRLKQRPVALEVKNLYKFFDSPKGQITALEDINFQAFKREFVCVIGPSGCGKSTLVRILAGLESIDRCGTQYFSAATVF